MSTVSSATFTFVEDVKTIRDCQLLCQKKSDCRTFVYNLASKPVLPKRCHLVTSDSPTEAFNHVVMGPQNC